MDFPVARSLIRSLGSRGPAPNGFRLVFVQRDPADKELTTTVTSETGRSVTCATGKLPIEEETDVATLSQLAIPPGDESQDSQDRSNQTILVQDLDAQNQVVAESAVTIESGTKGALTVSGIPREFIVGDDVSDDIPTWVIINGWHQFLYVAYGDAFRPDAVFPYVANSDGTCPAQSPCLTVYPGRTTAPQSSGDTASPMAMCMPLSSAQAWR